MNPRTYQDLHADMTAWLEGILKDGLDAARFATVYIEEESPRDGKIHVEVKGRHCRSGNPTTASFDYYDDSSEAEEDTPGLLVFERDGEWYWTIKASSLYEPIPASGPFSDEIEARADADRHIARWAE